MNTIRRSSARIQRICLAALCLMVLPVCSKSVEGETKRWQKNLQKTQELEALYPGFKGAITAQRGEAQKAMDAAKAITDTEAAIEAMGKANGILMAGFMGKLAGVGATTQKISQQITTATTGAGDETDRLAAKAAADNAQRLLQSVEALLKQGAADPIGAGAIVSKAAGDLKVASNSLQRVINEAKRKKAEAQKATANTTAKPGTNAPAPAAQQAPQAQHWTCDYCQKKNLATATQCSSCGAPHK